MFIFAFVNELQHKGITSKTCKNSKNLLKKNKTKNYE